MGASTLWGNSIVKRGGADVKKSACFSESSSRINDPDEDTGAWTSISVLTLFQATE